MHRRTASSQRSKAIRTGGGRRGRPSKGRTCRSDGNGRAPRSRGHGRGRARASGGARRPKARRRPHHRGTHSTARPRLRSAALRLACPEELRRLRGAMPGHGQWRPGKAGIEHQVIEPGNQRPRPPHRGDAEPGPRRGAKPSTGRFGSGSSGLRIVRMAHVLTNNKASSSRANDRTSAQARLVSRGAREGGKTASTAFAPHTDCRTG